MAGVQLRLALSVGLSISLSACGAGQVEQHGEMRVGEELPAGFFVRNEARLKEPRCNGNPVARAASLEGCKGDASFILQERYYRYLVTKDTGPVRTIYEYGPIYIDT